MNRENPFIFELNKIIIWVNEFGAEDFRILQKFMILEHHSDFEESVVLTFGSDYYMYFFFNNNKNMKWANHIWVNSWDVHTEFG